MGMVARAVHECECEACQRGEDAGQKMQHQRMNLLMSRLDEQQRRWYAAVESNKIGYGGDMQIARITGMNVETIRRGQRELAEHSPNGPRTGFGWREEAARGSKKTARSRAAIARPGQARCGGRSHEWAVLGQTEFGENSSSAGATGNMASDGDNPALAAQA
jgi:hypothetical protein